MAKCPEYEYRFSWGSGDYCKKIGDYIKDKDFYQKFCIRDYNRCFRYNNSNNSSCYLTTITCNVLGKDDNDLVLEKLRDFRNNILQKDEKYDEILKDYDVIGPIIAEEVRNDSNAYELASKIYNKHLLNICYKVDNKEYDEAVNKYFIMTYYLMLYYGLTDKYWNIKKSGYGYTDFELDRSNSGHGKRKVLVKEKQ